MKHKTAAEAVQEQAEAMLRVVMIMKSRQRTWAAASATLMGVDPATPGGDFSIWGMGPVQTTSVSSTHLTLDTLRRAQETLKRSMQTEPHMSSLFSVYDIKAALESMQPEWLRDAAMFRDPDLQLCYLRIDLRHELRIARGFREVIDYIHAVMQRHGFNPLHFFEVSTEHDPLYMHTTIRIAQPALLMLNPPPPPVDIEPEAAQTKADLALKPSPEAIERAKKALKLC